MKQITLIAGFFLCSLGMTAQNSNNISTQVSKEIEILRKADLNLSDIQLSRITQVLAGQEQIQNRNNQALEGNKAVLAQRNAELRKSKIQNIKGAMTEQQREKFDALKLTDKF
ncbi:hypothetical protein EMGBS15_11970 [Filimonas sp.]|nr:hypothetical protein EMGBS15_11970 [Filimonas sp.]